MNSCNTKNDSCSNDSKEKPKEFSQDIKLKMPESASDFSEKTEAAEQNKSESQYYLNIFNLHHRIPVIIYLKQICQKKKYNKLLRVFLCLLSATAYLTYLSAALLAENNNEDLDYWCDGAGFLLINTIFWGFLLFYFQVLKPYCVKFIYEKMKKNSKLKSFWTNKKATIIRYALVALAYLGFLLYDASDNYSRLISAAGGIVFIVIAAVFSLYPSQIKISQIIWGVSLQFIFGIVILRWKFGKATFECLGKKVSTFLSFTDVGTIFAIGDFLNETNSYAFKILPVVLYFGMFISIFYHYGIIQWIIIKLGWVLESTIGTTPCESMGAAANIFLGQSEAPLVIRPYVALLTKSELHAVMTSGFATVAGGVLAAYISFGISPAHLLSASIISAPAALVMAKVFYPEVEKSVTKSENIVIIRDKNRNVIQAVVTDMRANLPLIANITAALIIAMSGAAFVNAASDWFCHILGYEEGVCRIQVAIGYLLYPAAWLMGVPSQDCFDVGYLLGIKVFISEFLAYKELTDKFRQGLLSARAVTISTYALCGFSSIASIGCQVGALGCMAPTRLKDISSIIVRAFVAGNFACFLTACIAGTLVEDTSERIATLNVTLGNIEELIGSK